MSQTAGVSMYPFERFTDQAKQALSVAQTEAERSGKTYIGTEHLLLGLFQVDGAMAPGILADLGVEIGTARATIDSILGQEEQAEIRQIIPTSRVKRAIEIAFEEARGSGEGFVGTQHLLLGLAIEGEGIAGHVLDDLGVTEDRLKEAIARLSAAGMTEGAASEAPPPPPAGRRMVSPDPARMARALDDPTALRLLAALQERFGTTTPPPPRLLALTAQLREVRDKKQAAVSAQDYEAAKHLRDEELRLEVELTAQLNAWRHHPA